MDGDGDGDGGIFGVSGFEMRGAGLGRRSGMMAWGLGEEVE